MEGIQPAIGSNGAGTPARRLPLQRRTRWLELHSEPPRSVMARVVRCKMMWGHRGYSPGVQSWRRMTPRWLTAVA
jgi:hypothetical protein